MEFMSNKTDEIRLLLKSLKTPENSPEKALYSALVELLDDISKQHDLLNAKLQELEDFTESMSMDLHDIQEIIIKNLDLDSLDNNSNACECEDGKCECCGDEAREDDFYTLQCPFCEELFFIEKDELDETIDCPFCNKPVKAIDNIVKH